MIGILILHIQIVFELQIRGTLKKAIWYVNNFHTYFTLSSNENCLLLHQHKQFHFPKHHDQIQPLIIFILSTFCEYNHNMRKLMHTV